MPIQPSTPVVVGVDGSESSLAAVRVAVREAGLRRRSLRVVHAFVWPLVQGSMTGLVQREPDTVLRRDAEQIVRDAVAEAAKADPDVAVTGDLVTGRAGGTLVDASREAALIVLGDRGLGGFAGLLVGSIAVQVAAHGACPVLVVRGREHPSGPVVVGVDGSASSDAAVEMAFEEASARGAQLLAVHFWTGPVSTGPGDMLPLVYDYDDVEADEVRLLAESLAGWRDRYPDVPVTRRVIRGHPAHGLVDESAQAQLLVVGARGRGGFTGLLLGSVSQAVLHHAACPVAIVRATRP
ncbi:MAG TPA: universal stress protein [Micromonosporaceae bacterium]|jgi:nucleotide-binding universal stress UspA family protein